MPDKDFNYILLAFHSYWEDHGKYTRYDNKQQAYTKWLFYQWKEGTISLDEFRGAIQINI
jgi:hypothetical protein